MAEIEDLVGGAEPDADAALRSVDPRSSPETSRPATEKEPPAPSKPAVDDAGQPLERSRGRVRRFLLAPATVAVAVWVLGVPLDVVAVNTLDLNPLRSRGALLPLAVGLFLIAMVTAAAVCVRRPLLSGAVAGAAAGLAAVWVQLCILSAFNGTPFGDSGLRGDAARLTAMVTRYTVTLQPVDGFVPSVPTEYPPLFPWLIARVANLTHTPGWALLGGAQALLMSLTVLVGFLLWQRMVPPWPAVMLAIAAPLAFGQPRKVYEIFTMAVLVPCALAALCRFRRPGGMHWLVAGVALGLILQVYQGYVLFTAAGLAVLAFLGWRDARRGGEGRAFLLHIAGIIATAVVVAAWYLVPFVHGLLTIGGPRVNDSYVAGEITGDPFAVNRLLDGPLAPLTIAGLVGLVALRRRRWWASALLVLLGAAYLYRMVYLLVFVTTGHTGYLDYTGRIISMLLIMGGILTLWTAAPIVAARLSHNPAADNGATSVAARLSHSPAADSGATSAASRLPERPAVGVGAVSAAVFAGTAMFLVWRLWTPSPIGASDPAPRPLAGAPNFATYAHAEPLPDGSLPRFNPIKTTIKWFPVTPIEDAVRRRLGPDAEPVTLSASEKLFAYLPWPAYVAVERASTNTYTHFDERVTVLRALSQITNPAAFADASSRTRFGPIDVFVLTERSSGWVWGGLQFSPRSFDSAHWWVEHLPNNTVVAIRR